MLHNGYMGSKKFHDIIKYIKKTDTPIAMVFGLGINGLGVVRSLGRRGIPIIGLDPNPSQLGLFSRYCKGVVCPDPAKQEEEYVNLLLTLGEKMITKGVIIQSEEADILTILKHKNKLEQYYKIPIANFDIIEKLANKGKFYKMLEKLDMPHPKTYFPSDILEVEKISKKITYPCIIKPVFSLDFSEEFSIKCFKANCSEELIEAYNRAVSSGHEVVIQEVVPGSDTNLYLVGAYFNHVSEPLGIFTFRRVRQYPHGFGNGALCVSIWMPEIAELCTSFLKKIKYHGIIDAELKRDPRDNKFKFIEINPRTGWQNRLAARCGVDLPYMAYRDATGESVEKPISKREGVKWLYMFYDLMSSFESISKHELTVTEWVNSLKGEKEYAIFAWDDPLPFFVSLSNLGFAVLRYSMRHSISYAKSAVGR